MYTIKFKSAITKGVFDKIIWADSEEEARMIFEDERPGCTIISIAKLH
jgi:hypothetical protein